ncbi:2-amino-4-hydroxy-6-hydroxymethyldihydropteridine diphosphokinase [Candidatus Pelagibacter sp.]|nr:2-amino-4-hydroxy-6-hydroxymethyldihydropteridine diphosphokinase [Candidatus Pelagibacter sp.]
MKKQDILENQVNSVYLALGSNLGNKKTNLNKCIDLIKKEEIFIKKRSKFYSTKSWPNENFPNFINAIILIETKFTLTELFLKIKKIEKKLGRTISKRNYPRVCDIDIIDYNGEIIHRKFGKHKLNIPHKRMHNRNFVLFPLYEIDKDWVHPKLNKNIVILMSNLASDQLLGVKIAQ